MKCPPTLATHMEFLTKPPKVLTDNLPLAPRAFLEGGGWLLIVAAVALVVLLIVLAAVWKVVRALTRRKGKWEEDEQAEVNVQALPAAPPRPAGQYQLLIEGIPVRVRLVVLAPVSRKHALDRDAAYDYLDQVLPGLGDLAAEDEPQVHIWPAQLSDEGFANTFHRNTPGAGKEHAASPWVMLAGRVHGTAFPFFLGLGLQAERPTPLGRRRVQMHEWEALLRIRGAGA